MNIDPVSVVGWVCLGFCVGVLFRDLTAKQPRRRKRLPKPPRRDRLRTDYVINDDHTRLFQVRCQPRALDRLLAKIKDETCEGR